jgi:hypothetical protein
VERNAGLEALMAARKIMVSSSISAQIDSTAKKLKKARPRVSAPDQKKIDLEIKALASCKKALGVFCRKMTHSFRPKPEGEK